MNALKMVVNWGVVSLFATNCFAVGIPLTDMEQVGKFIFFDENLSLHQNQSCAACHGPEAGWTGPDFATNEAGAVYEGSITGEFGNRKPPSAAYATQSPIFHTDKKGLFVGGNFWDGRATGENLGNPAADQAQGPFLNPKEQALPDATEVVTKICASSYRVQFLQVCEDACTTTPVSDTYDCVGLSIAAYEASPEVNAFSSKYDLSFYGEAKLTPQERRGRALFRGKGKCKLCHTSNGQEALFTDFTFDNLGLPKNPANPVYDDEPDFVDYGLGGILETDGGYSEEIYEAEMGKHKVPTLRNVGKGSCEAESPGSHGCIVKSYGHNGYFKTLKGIVHFYNTRDVKEECDGDDYTETQALADDCWPAPEVAANVNTEELGDLGLTDEEEKDIVAFMMTLSDLTDVTLP